VLDIKDYSPGKFARLMKRPFAADLWNYLSDEGRVRLMLDAGDRGKPAIEPLLAEIESLFGGLLASPEYPDEEIATFINNMIKHILKTSGCDMIACALCPGARYIKSSGLFKKRPRR
jgi:hypothetical protein